ncbi:MAG: NTP transferase domain-containing protein [Sulfolobales archaeon]|nr:NTP transferase domain-containing protein [Sulfolobales archaeon]MDW8082223.1 NTP transferase domain-containing protein [Sulfolobales archaeon]
MEKPRVTCLLLAGGAGTRFGSSTKFLREVCGEPIALRLLHQLESVCKYVVVAISHRTIKAARALCESPSTLCVEFPGTDYVSDLNLALRILPKPILTVAADIVARDGVIQRFLEDSLSKNVDVVTAVVVSHNKLPNPVGLALFNSEGGSWADVNLGGGAVLDVDTEEDLESAGRICE